jgi:hypothetical protein
MIVLRDILKKENNSNACVEMAFNGLKLLKNDFVIFIYYFFHRNTIHINKLLK